MPHPSVGPVTALATEVFVGDLPGFATVRKLGIRLWTMLRDQIDDVEH
jgi:hypothetical protein